MFVIQIEFPFTLPSAKYAPMNQPNKLFKRMKKPSYEEIYMELAEKLALRSHCVKAQVGAVLTKDTRIVSLGYNGPPAGTHNCDIE